MNTRLWDTWNNGGGPQYPHAKVIQFCMRNYPPAVRSATRVLDLGCGSGVNTRFLAEQGFDCVATDISLVGLANTQALLAPHGLRASCAVAEISAQPFADASFDCAITIGVLDSAGPATARKAVSELRRTLKLGGRAICVFASDADMRVGAATAYGLYGYRHDEVVELTTGFAEVAIDRYITTYDSGRRQHNDFLVTLTR